MKLTKQNVESPKYTVNSQYFYARSEQDLRQYLKARINSQTENR